MKTPVDTKTLTWLALGATDERKHLRKTIRRLKELGATAAELAPWARTCEELSAAIKAVADQCTEVSIKEDDYE